MTDEQILIELARRVHGWKIVPKWADEAWFADDSNYPCLHNGLYRSDVGDRGDRWNPLDDTYGWNHAMALAEKWMDSEAGNWYDLERLPVHGYHVYVFPGDAPEDISGFRSAVDQSGPRAVTLAIARATGIEVDR